ncbi:MAG: sel1 repeat family protein, partial [Rhizobiales bacterium]|nr:sel1 repeat family protein [Hyphomicrobiales bacterium]
IAADRWFGAAFLAEMLANGAVGAADPKRALALLRDERARYGFRVPQTLAQLLLDNRFVGPDPHQAARLLAGSGDIDAAIAAVPLLVDYGTALRDPARFLKRLRDAAAAGEPGAAMALARLRVAPGSPLADITEGRRWLRTLAEAGDPDAAFLLAATQFANLDTQSSQPYRRDDDGPSDDAIRKLIDDGIAAKRADAFLLRAKLLRRGVLYPQDDRAATLDLTNAANLGSLEAMLLLGEAYDDGLGTPEDPRERLRAWREAAKHGSFEARRRIATAFSFDTFDKLITLREGVSERIALLNLDAGRGGPGMPAGIAATMGVAGLSSGGRAADAGVPALAGAVLDGYRIAPSGLDEAVLVPTLKAFPAEIRLAMEAALHRDGFLKRSPDGYFGPDARDALRAFVDARGPLPSLEATAVPAAAVGASGTTLDPALVDRVRDDTFRRAQQVKTKAERTAVIRQLNLLAAYGDVASRWAILRNYHQADFVRNNVSAGEATRYGLDILVGRPAGVEKADFEFIFVVTQIESDGEIEAFGTATLGAIRDDPRLRDPLTLGSVLQTLLFAPGACDALLAAARSEGVDSLGSDGCDEASKAALVAFAEARGPSGVDAKARAAAATAIAALDAGR